MSFLSSIFSGGQPSQPSAPSFQTDPLVGSTDTTMSNFGTNALNGILPAPYQDLLQSNSPQFQQMLNNSNAQIQGSSMATSAMQGNARSGAAQAGATQAIASNTANLSYADLLNTQLNQKAILGTGLTAVQGANQGALANQGQENQFASSIYGTQMQGYGQNLNYNAQMADLSANVAKQIGGGLQQGIADLPFWSGSSGSGLGGTLGSFDSLTGGTAASAGSFAGTGGIDALLSSGAPLVLAAA